MYTSDLRLHDYSYTIHIQDENEQCILVVV